MEREHANTDTRPDPEELLAKIQRQTESKTGRLKVFLGFAAGVGKTFEMLTEAARRKQRGQDVVIGYVETHGRKGTVEQLGDIEIIPRKQVQYRGVVVEEMDTEAIIKRHPRWCLVDELAHTNAPGSARQKRWQDVQEILAAGINVLTTLNVQHLESLNDTIHDVTGVWVKETVPDRIVHDADEVVMIDITPRALINRLERGDIYPQERIERAMANWFKDSNLNALREIALREVAHEVDEAQAEKTGSSTTAPAVHDSVMVCISPYCSSLRLIRRGWRIAQRLHADIVAVHVENKPPTQEQQEFLRNDYALVDRLQIPLVILHGDVADQLIRYAREHRITQIVIGHSQHNLWHEIVKGSIITKLTRALRAVDILIVAAAEDTKAR